MRNGKDKGFIKLLILFVLYYLINRFFPGITSSKVFNVMIKDTVFMILAILVYIKELGLDYRRFRKSDRKFIFVLWAIGIYAVMYGIIFLSHKYFKSLPGPMAGLYNKSNLSSLFGISWYYAFFRTIIYTSVAELILFSLSIRKIITNDILFVVLSAALFAFFGYIFSGFHNINFVYVIFINFIPMVLYNISYIKNNNLVSVMFINFLCNLVPFILYLVR